VAGALEWLRWPEKKRSELGDRFRSAALRDHSGASWKSRWLDPAISSLSLPQEDHSHSEPEAQQREFSFLGLGRASWVTDWPAGMFVAGAILNADHVPRPIRVSGLLHSIKPLLFDTAGDGKPRQRLRMFAGLAEPFVPNRILSALRRAWRAIISK